MIRRLGIVVGAVCLAAAARSPAGAPSGASGGTEVLGLARSSSDSFGLMPIRRVFGVCAKCEVCGSQQDNFEAMDQETEPTDWEAQPCVYDVCRWREFCFEDPGGGPICCEDGEAPDMTVSVIDQVPSAEELTSVWNAALAGDIAGVRRGMALHPNHIVVNASRGSLQFIGCDGVGVLGNLPLAEGALALLQRSQGAMQ